MRKNRKLLWTGLIYSLHVNNFHVGDMTGIIYMFFVSEFRSETTAMMVNVGGLGLIVVYLLNVKKLVVDVRIGNMHT